MAVRVKNFDSLLCDLTNGLQSFVHKHVHCDHS